MNVTAHFDVEKAKLIEKIEQRNSMLEQLIQNNYRIKLLNSEQLHKLEDIKNKNEKFRKGCFGRAKRVYELYKFLCK